MKKMSIVIKTNDVLVIVDAWQHVRTPIVRLSLLPSLRHSLVTNW